MSGVLRESIHAMHNAHNLTEGSLHYGKTKLGGSDGEYSVGLRVTIVISVCRQIKSQRLKTRLSFCRNYRAETKCENEVASARFAGRISSNNLKT